MSGQNIEQDKYKHKRTTIKLITETWEWLGTLPQSKATVSLEYLT